MSKYIIVGNGVAANAAAERIRKIDPQGSVQMFSREKFPFYYVPGLIEYLSGEKDLKGITIHNKKWYEEKNIELFLNTEIVEINPSRKTVTTKTNNIYNYDQLLLATGGYSFVPPIKGVENEGIFSLRTIEDANRIREKAVSSKELVLIGGGLLGLEAGYALHKLGLKVTVIEFFPRLLPRQMDVNGAAMLQKQLEETGFSFFLGSRTEEISEKCGKLWVNLEEGQGISADIVLFSAGVRPELNLAKDLELEINKGVKVNDMMQTEIPNIFAAGDLIEHRDRFYGIWPASMQQGRIAGANMAGKEEMYGGTVMSNTLKVVGIDLTSAGNIDAEEKLESIVSQDQEKKIYRKIVVNNNTIEGVILFGDIRGSNEILKAIETKKDISPFINDISRKDFDFSLFL